MSSREPVRVAGGRYVHVEGIAGDGAPDRLDVRYVTMRAGAVFRRMLQGAAFDVAEMSLSTVYVLADRRDDRFVALPVFPSRVFRHSALWVPRDSPARRLADLGGCRIGVLRYAMTTAVWVRALLADAGVPPDSLDWWVGEAPDSPVPVPVTEVAGTAALEALARRGGLDCLISGVVSGASATGELRRLFPDFGHVEQQYHASSGIFPIMHAFVATRRFATERAHALAALLARFDHAKRSALDVLTGADVSGCPLPWLSAYVDDARRRMGEDLWPYGVEGNRRTLEAFGAAMASQHLTARALGPEEVFPGV